MQSKIYAVLTTLVGVLLLLPLMGVNSFGTLTEGVLAWIVAVAILLIGLTGISKTYGKKKK